MTLPPLVFALGVVLVGGLRYEPTILNLTFDDGHQELIAATSPETCETAIRAINGGLWVPAHGAVTASCAPGDLFAPGSTTIPGLNDSGRR